MRASMALVKHRIRAHRPATAFGLPTPSTVRMIRLRLKAPNMCEVALVGDQSPRNRIGLSRSFVGVKTSSMRFLVRARVGFDFEATRWGGVILMSSVLPLPVPASRRGQKQDRWGAIGGFIARQSSRELSLRGIMDIGRALGARRRDFG